MTEISCWMPSAAEPVVVGHIYWVILAERLNLLRRRGLLRMTRATTPGSVDCNRLEFIGCE